jgi:hypothetical protein
MMKMSTDLNRYNDVGIFGSTNWEEGDDGKWTRTNSANEALQPGIESLMSFASNQDQQPNYTQPDQFSQLLDAKMANQMQRHGIGEGGAPPDPASYGAPAAQQQGGQGPSQPPNNQMGPAQMGPPPSGAVPQGQSQPQGGMMGLFGGESPAPQDQGAGLLGSIMSGENGPPQGQGGGGSLMSLLGGGGGGQGGRSEQSLQNQQQQQQGGSPDWSALQKMFGGM